MGEGDGPVDDGPVRWAPAARRAGDPGFRGVRLAAGRSRRRAASGESCPPTRPPELDFLVARDLELDGELEPALEAYQRALAKDPEATELLRKVAELSARAGRLEDAVAYAERAYALDPADRSTRLFLGTLYRFLKDPAARRAGAARARRPPVRSRRGAAPLRHALRSAALRRGDGGGPLADRERARRAARLVRPGRRRRRSSATPRPPSRPCATPWWSTRAS